MEVHTTERTRHFLVKKPKKILQLRLEDKNVFNAIQVNSIGYVFEFGECDWGIFVDGVGYGSALIANKINGIYAAVCQDPFCAKLARQHTDSNVLCLGAKIIGDMMAGEIVKTWLNTQFEGGRHQRRVDLLDSMGDAN